MNNRKLLIFVSLVSSAVVSIYLFVYVSYFMGFLGGLFPLLFTFPPLYVVLTAIIRRRKKIIAKIARMGASLSSSTNKCRMRQISILQNEREEKL